MTSIRFRLISTYLLIILLTVGLVEFGVYSLINNYYITNIGTILKSEQDICVDLYEQLYYSQDLYMESESIATKLIGYTNAQLQLLDTDNRVLYDSIHQYERGTLLDFQDVEAAVMAEEGRWQGELETGEPVFAITQRLMLGNESVGAIRFVTSLEDSYAVINQLMMILLGIGLGIIVVVFLVSLVISNSIIKPIQKIAEHAKEIAKGNYENRLEKTNNDEIGRLTDDLNHMAIELSRTEAMKDQFIASISHELRTPLTSIKGWIVTLRTGKKEDEALVEEGYGIIENETDRLTGLVNELLDFSKLSSHQLSVHRSPMCMNDLMNYIYRQMEPRAKRQHLKFELQIDENVMLVDGDYNRLKQVLINLVDNAFKHTPASGTVLLKAYKHNGQCFIKVIDNGSGITEKDLPEVFNRYYQGENASEGGGLGLTLCKEIVALHDGIIDINSVDGDGTTVYVVLKALDDEEKVKCNETK